MSSIQVPGRPPDERLLAAQNHPLQGGPGRYRHGGHRHPGTWPLAQDLRQKPLYTLTVSGSEGHPIDNALFLVSRGLEEVEWWSAYQLASGRHLFDAYVPLVSFSISRETVTTRYVGLEVPPDDTTDGRLKQPNVVAVLTYASRDRVIREALLTCDDPRRAALLRSYADASRTLSVLEDANQPTRTLRLYLSVDYPSPPDPAEVRIPVRNDDLDLAHAQLPPRLHLAPWKR